MYTRQSKTGFANAPCFKAHECFGRLSKYRCCSAKRMRGHYLTVPGLYETFFGDYLRFCAQQYYSDSWFSTTRSALRLFLLAVNRHGIRNTTEINQGTIGLYSDLLFGNNELCQNTKRHHSKCVSIYLRWLFEHGKISEIFHICFQI